MPKKNLKPTTEIDLDEFSIMMAQESDRACGVLGAALLDAKLESIFRTNLKLYEKELLDNFSSPLSSFSARIVLARALNWINDDAYHDLNKIRSIRNEFAHSFDHALSFGNQSIVDRCADLRIARSYIDGFNLIDNSPNNQLQFGLWVIENFKKHKEKYEPPRQRYEITINLLCQYLDTIPIEINEYKGYDIVQDVNSLSANTLARMSTTAIIQVVES
jgi:hypothetical protein